MKLLSTGNAAVLSVVTMCFATISPSYADSGNAVEAGRLQICKITGSSAALDEIEIPADGKYVIAAEKVGLPADVVINQSDFSTDPGSASQGQNNSALKDRFSVENRNGKVLVHLKFNGLPCIYLNAEAPVLKGSSLTLSGTHVVPSWATAVSGFNVGGLSYRYFNSIDQTYYVASEVGKTLSFAVHGLQTGSNLNRDQVHRVAVSNPEVLALLPAAFKENLEKLNQFDINLIDTGKLKIDPENLDFHSSSGLAELVSQFKKALQPPPHSRLILALPKRAEVRMVFTNTTLVGNKFEGLGFYRDLNLSNTSDLSPEIVVPIDAFINFQSAVIDLDTATLVASQSYADGRVFHTSIGSENDPADSSTDPLKMSALRQVVTQGVFKVMNGMFAVKQAQN